MLEKFIENENVLNGKNNKELLEISYLLINTFYLLYKEEILNNKKHYSFLNDRNFYDYLCNELNKNSYCKENYKDISFKTFSFLTTKIFDKILYQRNIDFDREEVISFIKKLWIATKALYGYKDIDIVLKLNNNRLSLIDMSMNH